MSLYFGQDVLKPSPVDEMWHTSAGGWESGAQADGRLSVPEARGRLLCLPVTIFDTPHALINLDIPCTSGTLGRSIYVKALGEALKRYQGRELVVGGGFNGVLDDNDILPRPTGSTSPIACVTQHLPVTALLSSYGATDRWREVMGSQPSFTYKHTHNTDDHGASRLDTFYLTPNALTPKATEGVTRMGHLLGYPGELTSSAWCVLCCTSWLESAAYILPLVSSWQVCSHDMAMCTRNMSMIITMRHRKARTEDLLSGQFRKYKMHA